MVERRRRRRCRRFARGLCVYIHRKPVYAHTLYETII